MFGCEWVWLGFMVEDGCKTYGAIGFGLKLQENLKIAGNLWEILRCQAFHNIWCLPDFWAHFTVDITWQTRIER